MGFSSVVRGMFPFISAAASLGGPLGSMAANAVGKALGIDNLQGTGDSVSNAIMAVKDPAALAALQKAEQDFQVQMTELGYKEVNDLLAIDAADRQDARKREETVRDHTNEILAFVIVAFTILAEGFLLVHGQPKNIDGVVLGRIMGTLDAALMLVLSYYYGSSSGSSEKTKLMAAQAAGKQG